MDYDKTFHHVLGYRRMRMYINHFNQTNFSVGYIHRLMKILGLKQRLEGLGLATENLNLNIQLRTFWIETLLLANLMKNGYQM